MLIVMKQGARPEDLQGVLDAVAARGYKGHPIPGGQRTAVGVTGNQGADDAPVDAVETACDCRPVVLERCGCARTPELPLHLGRGKKSDQFTGKGLVISWRGQPRRAPR